MELYARAAQVKFPSYAEIVVLGADTKGSPGSSETVMVAEGNPNLSEAEKAETLAMMEEHQILSTLGDFVSISYRPSMPAPRIFGSSWAATPPDKLGRPATRSTAAVNLRQALRSVPITPLRLAQLTYLS